MKNADLREAALAYHEADPPGKIAIQPTKPVANQNDLALAYSPGVAHACLAIAEDNQTASKYTARGNLVGVITNGTAVLGLGNIGPLASKPVMEGKGVLFKKFAGIDCFDIEVDALEDSTPSSMPSPVSSPPSAASTWRTSKHLNASRSSAA